MLLMVRRLEGALGNETDEKGFGDTRSFFTTGRRADRVGREEDAVPFDSLAFVRGGGGRYGEGFLTVFAFGGGGGGELTVTATGAGADAGGGVGAEGDTKLSIRDLLSK